MTDEKKKVTEDQKKAAEDQELVAGSREHKQNPTDDHGGTRDPDSEPVGSGPSGGAAPSKPTETPSTGVEGTTPTEGGG